MTDAEDGGAPPQSGRFPPPVAQIEASVEQVSDERLGALYSVLSYQQFHSGPLPSPGSLAGYEILSPGLAREIVDMAVRQQLHDQGLESTSLASEIRYRVLTLIAAGLVELVLVVGAVWCAYLHETRGVVTLGVAAGAAPLAGAFLKGRDLFAKKPQPTPTPSQQKSSKPPQKARGQTKPKRPNP